MFSFLTPCQKSCYYFAALKISEEELHFCKLQFSKYICAKFGECVLSSLFDASSTLTFGKGLYHAKFSLLERVKISSPLWVGSRDQILEPIITQIQANR